MVHTQMSSLEKSIKLSNSPIHLSLGLDTSSSRSSIEINMESQTNGGPPNSITLQSFKNMALFLSSRIVHFSFNDFTISILPFQPVWNCLILGLEGKDLLFLDSSISDINFVTNVDIAPA